MLKVEVEEKDKLPKVCVGDAIQIGSGKRKLNGIIVENGIHRYSVLCFSESEIPFLWRKSVREEPFYDCEFPVLTSNDPQLLVEYLAYKYDHVEKLKSMTIKITEED